MNPRLDPPTSLLLDPSATLALAEQVSQIAESLGIRTALIGAAALAVHGYARGTTAIDLVASVPADTLRQLLVSAQTAGLRADLPDDTAFPDGVLVIWVSPNQTSDSIAMVQVINFTDQPQAVIRAPLEGLQLSCVSLADLVALKLYAGRNRHLADIVPLLANNPDADLDALRSIVSPHHRADLEELLAAARTLRVASTSAPSATFGAS